MIEITGLIVVIAIFAIVLSRHGVSSRSKQARARYFLGPGVQPDSELIP